MAQESDFLFELYTEEAPASYQEAAIVSWRQKLPQAALESGLSFQEIEISGTARRLYALIKGLAGLQETAQEELKGPPKEICFKDGEAAPPLIGFAKKAGVDPSEVYFTTIDSKEYACAKVTRGGGSAVETLGPIFEELIKKQKFPKSMRWGSKSITYARPILQYTARYGAENVSYSSEFWDNLLQVDTPLARMWPERKNLELKNGGDYESELQKEGVICNHEKRRAYIEKILAEAAGQESAIVPKHLLDEVVFLVERPVAVRGSFDAGFLELPEALILSEMNDHQRYFGLRNQEGALTNEFITIANGAFESPQAKENISRGNEKVLRARLSDGDYFFKEDRKRPLGERIDDLKRVVYQEGMGTLFDKKERLKKLAPSLLESSGFAPQVLQEGEKLERVADLAKADLTTLLVYEFDHLQGEIGAIYAKSDGEDPEVAQAIAEHYLPRHQDDDYPASPMGISLSIADKMDNIMAGFILKKQPTAAQDPLGLRRQALYVIEMIIRNKISFPLFEWLQGALSNYKSDAASPYDAGEIEKQLREFFLARLATIFEKEGFDKKLINAALYSGDGDLYGLYLKLTALKEMRDNEEFAHLMEAFKRMNNILNDFFAKNPQAKLPAEPNTKLFDASAPHEKELYEVALQLGESIAQLDTTQAESYRKVFQIMASGKRAVDGFFDNVMVMHDDESLRNNRLSLLQGVVLPVKNVLDISQLQ